MDRRTVLATTGIALSVPLAGCFSAVTGDETDQPDRPWPPSDPITHPEGAHHLFVENHTDSTETAWLRVVREDEATLVDGRYELPDRRGLKFEAIAAWEMTYSIDLALDGEGVTTMKWHTAACRPDSEAPRDCGSRNAAVRVMDTARDDNADRVSLVMDQCDALFAPGVPTGPADTFRRDE